jgi:hypothetical protein
MPKTPQEKNKETSKGTIDWILNKANGSRGVFATQPCV